MVRGIVVGLDPGTTTGIAVLDIEGKLIYLGSKRNAKRSDIVKIVTNLGRPILFATDVYPPPRAVERLASTFGCLLFCPSKSLSVLEKQDLVKEYGEKIIGHEADALAASIKAWKNYRRLFEKLKSSLADRSCPELFEEVAIKLLKQGSDNVDTAVEEVLLQRSKEPEQAEQTRDRTEDKFKDILREKDLLIKDLENRIHTLSKALERKRLESKITDRLQFSFARTEDYEKEIEDLKRANSLLKAFEKIRRKNMEPLVEIEEISGLEIEKLDKLIGLEGRVVYCNSLENISVLNPFGIKAFVTENEDEIDKGKLEFPVLKIDSKDVKEVEGVKAINSEVFENELKKVRKEGLTKWLENYRKRKRNY